MDNFLSIMKYLGGLILFAAVILIIYNVLKRYVLSKIKANKWVILALAIVTFVLPTILMPQLHNTFLTTYVTSGVFVVLFLWFLDLSGFIKNKEVTPSRSTQKRISNYKNNKNDVIIKPKAKPNRVKK